MGKTNRKKKRRTKGKERKREENEKKKIDAEEHLRSNTHSSIDFKYTHTHHTFLRKMLDIT